MLLAFLISNIIALTVASSFHKYPYVFLLDVGNEELEKTNTEQLRVSIPGGSLALKYPAVGEGDTIAHVRVSGIDFGTDLKANIVEGGPGYKYVVIVFMGNPGVSYDAVISLQTLTDDADTSVLNNNQDDDAKTDVDSNSYEVSEESNENDCDKNAKDNSNTMKVYSQKSNAEVMQSSSTFYNYATNEMSSNDDGDADELENNSAEELDESSDEENSSTNEESSDVSDDDSSEVKDHIGIENQLNAGAESLPYTSKIEDSYAMDEDKPADIVDDSLYEKYQDLKPHFSNNFKIYPQSDYGKQFEDNSVYDQEDAAEFEQMFNDEEVHNDIGKYRDWNNNVDSQYIAAEY